MCLAGSCIQILCFMLFSQDLPHSSSRESTCCSPNKILPKPDKDVERLFRMEAGYSSDSSSATKSGGLAFCSKAYIPAFDILKMKQPNYLSRFKNPCWISEGRFLCVPYFHLIGVAKCGTTDLFEKIARHSEFRKPSVKEPKWFSTRRFRNDTTANLQYYATEFFGEAAKEIEASGHNDQLSELITGEASINTIDGCMFWQLMPQNRGKDEPVVNNPEFIYHINPNARILINVRNPVDRLWSEYLAFTQDKEASANKFHDIVVRAISIYNKCLEYKSLRSCMYSKRLADYSTMNDAERKSHPDGCGKIPKDIVYLRRGVYHVFIRDYLKVFPRDQILVQRLEDISENQMMSLSKVFKFLDMGPLDEELENTITALGIRNSRTPDRKKGDMLKKTRIILENFYRPHNKELAKLLNDDGEHWLGLDKIHRLAQAGAQIYFQLENYDGTFEHAHYKAFTVHDVTTAYKMNVDAFGYDGTIKELISYHDDMKFSTFDRDNDKHSGNCCLGHLDDGGWWFNACWRLNPNGVYGKQAGGAVGYYDGKTIHVKNFLIKIKRRKGLC